MTTVRGLAKRRALKRAGRAGGAVACYGPRRRSAGSTLTPVRLAPMKREVIVVSLTFRKPTTGVAHSWSRGSCSNQGDGQDYEATQPDSRRAQARGNSYRPVTSPKGKGLLRLLGIRQFMRLTPCPCT